MIVSAADTRQTPTDVLVDFDNDIPQYIEGAICLKGVWPADAPCVNLGIGG